MLARRNKATQTTKDKPAKGSVVCHLSLVTVLSIQQREDAEQGQSAIVFSETDGQSKISQAFLRQNIAWR